MSWINYIKGVLVTSCQSTEICWDTMLSNCEYKLQIVNWSDDSSRFLLFINVMPNGSLIPSVTVPMHKAMKIYYFFKTTSDRLTSVPDNIISGTLSADIFNCLQHFLKYICLPLLSNRLNHSAWPTDSGQDIAKMLDRILTTMADIQSTCTADVIELVPPTNIEHIVHSEASIISNDIACSSSLRNALEGCVIKWSFQLDDMFTHDRNTKFNLTIATPFEELAYWRNRLRILEHVREQLLNSQLVCVGRLLVFIKSVYCETFANIRRSLKVELVRARNNLLFLNALEQPLNLIRTSDFDKMSALLGPVLHCMALMWARIDDYKPSDWQRMLRMLCNLVQEETLRHLDQGSMFQADEEELANRLDMAIQVIETLEQEIRHYKSALDTEYKLPTTTQSTWSVQSKDVCSRLFVYLERIRCVRDVIQSAIEIGHLNRIELGGCKGKIVSDKLLDISHSYRKAYSMWLAIDFDVLDVDRSDADFQKVWTNYSAATDKLERALAQVLQGAFCNCYTTESCMKVTGSILNRKHIKPYMTKSFDHIVHLYTNDMLVVERKVKELEDNWWTWEHEHFDLEFPKEAAVLQWIRTLSNRLDKPLRDLAFLEFGFLENANGVEMLNSKTKILRRLERLEKVILDTWLQEVSSTLPTSMSQFLFTRTDKGLAVNLNESIFAILRNLRMINRLGLTERREDLRDVFAQSNPIWDLQIMLNNIATHYNYVNKKCSSVELGILQVQLDGLVQRLVPFYEQYTWIDYDQTAANAIQAETDKLYQQVVQAHSNVTKLKQHIFEWSVVPLYQRFSSADLEHANIATELERRVVKIKSTQNELDRVIELNFQIFAKGELHEKRAEPIESVVTVKRKRFKRFIGLTHKMRTSAKNSSCVPLGSSTIIQSTISRSVLVERDTLEPYKEYLRSICDHEMCDSAYISMDYLRDQLSNASAPLLWVKISLRGDSINVSPTTQSILTTITLMTDNIIESVLDSQLTCAGCEHQIHQKPSLETSQCEIIQSTSDVLSEANTFVYDLNQYEHIWKEDDIELMANQKHPSQTLQIKEQIQKWNECVIAIDQKIPSQTIIGAWIGLDLCEFKQSLLNECGKHSHKYQQHLVSVVAERLQEICLFIDSSNVILTTGISMTRLDDLLKVMSTIRTVRERDTSILSDLFNPLLTDVTYLKDNQVVLDESLTTAIYGLSHKWNQLLHLASSVQRKTEPNQQYHMSCVLKKMAIFTESIDRFRTKFQECMMCHELMSYTRLDRMQRELASLESVGNDITRISELFERTQPDFTKINQCRKELNATKILLDYVLVVRSCKDYWTAAAWVCLDIEDIEHTCKQLLKDIRSLGKCMQSSELYAQVDGTVKNLLTSLRSLTELKNSAIQDRHWEDLMRTTGMFLKFDMEFLKTTTLADLLQLNLHDFEEDVKNIVDRAMKEQSMKKFLVDITTIWSKLFFTFAKHERSDLELLHPDDKLIETLEDHQVQVHAIMNSKHVQIFENEFKFWEDSLGRTDAFITLWTEAQRKWIYLDSIFIRSDDLREQLPDRSLEFDLVNHDFHCILEEIAVTVGVIQITNRPGLVERIERLVAGLAQGEKALNDYLEQKRLAFPRFYFIATVDLLDILSNGGDPKIATRHLPKLYDSVTRLQFEPNDDNMLLATGMFSREHEEFVQFEQPFVCHGNVETWLNRITSEMRSTLRRLLAEAIVTGKKEAQETWVLKWSAQTALCISQIMWSVDVNSAFTNIQLGYESALRDYQRKLVSQLSALIGMLLGDLTPGDRQRIMTICTIQVHSRDIVSKMMGLRIDNGQAFQWQSQLRHRWDRTEGDCFANICDAQFRYKYEYLGNTPRLVITPLTDRCYITLTQSLHLVMGGAPSGPAGTGKTETTKDLGKGLGSMVYVFNCSNQMDYRSCAMIFKGLAQTGAWGCFDEFNRIAIEVLSVVAVQVKSILDALKRQQSTFVFMGETIQLVSSVGLFVTMNPGYAGRTELPENLKALFRPCAMVAPDLALICEIMLVAEGFQEARSLARKFISLYTLCRQLLSAQDHYDWGLRAIKSVLVVAGKLRRGDSQKPEEQVLMRALRDFNLPKIITNDITIFLGLINDLFPLLDVPRTTCEDVENDIRSAAQELGMQPNKEIVLKVMQLMELLEVRHSVFLVGAAGTGKSTIWRTLLRTLEKQNERPHYNDLNPKGVTNDELFGIINPLTREWKDGLFSKLMREQMNSTVRGPKWLILDGDIDPLWIESLNTVMDDNKVLTLASNERITLTSEMRLLFEAGDLKYATPATISRAGILFINTTHLTWQPFVTSWIEGRGGKENERLLFTYLFEKYLPIVIKKTREFKRITPVQDIAMAQMACQLLDSLLVVDASDEKWQELCFVFAIVWGFGSTFYADQIIDWQQEFNRFWMIEFKDVRIPNDDVFSFYLDMDAMAMRPWSRLLPKVIPNLNDGFQQMLVPTMESVRIKWFLDTLMTRHCPIMLIGSAGTGKSVTIRDKLDTLPELYQVINIPFNFYTTSESLQKILEEPLEKKIGRIYAPSCYKRIVFFADDLNMPEMDRFGTVESHQIIRQFMDYGHWYDRTRFSLRVIQNCQFVACMNPSSGTFRIDPRLQRHFNTFAVSPPSGSSMIHMYSTMLTHHLSLAWNRFTSPHLKIASELVGLSLTLHHRVSLMFLPTAVKFHYNFNLRDLSNIYQGMMFATADTCPDPEDLIRLYLHEASRVYSDKLVTQTDQDNFKKLLREVTKNELDEFDEQRMFHEPLIYCHFGDGLAETKYMPVGKWSQLNDMLQEAQDSYNEMIGPMSLVMFEDAMAHVCRINRIFEGPRGNVMLIGVGGSGKQSLVRLASFISGLTVSQIQLRRGYGMVDLKAHLNALFVQVGIKNASSVFLMSDAQIPDEQFLVVVNDLLASAEVQDLFTTDEMEGIINAVRNEVKQSGQVDTKTNCWKFFFDKISRGLKIVLCFSPVGSTLRQRARKFPGIVNCTTVDWFHEWPLSALQSVSTRFLNELEVLQDELIEPVSTFMSMVLESVKNVSQRYFENEHRFYYTTPKTYLESISLYSELLTTKTTETRDTIQRLENGLVKLSQCAELVEHLKKTLCQQEIIMAEKHMAADRLIVVVGAENEMVKQENIIAAEEERRVRRIEEDVQIKTRLCEKDLRKAEPALQAAQMALNTLNKTNLTELKSFGAPPLAVIKVCAAVLVLCSGRQKLPRDRSWKVCKQMMGSVDRFLSHLVRFDKEHIPSKVITALQPYLNDPDFDPQKIIAKSVAASGLCAWVINIYKFHSVYLIVGPKQRALKDAQLELDAAQEKLLALNQKIQAIESKSNAIQLEFEAAVADKIRYRHEAEQTSATIDLANRLVNGLASEAQRWHQSVERLRVQIGNLPGDMLFVSSFVVYVGGFTRPYRVDLVEKHWRPALNDIKPEIPRTKHFDLLEHFCDDVQIAKWNNEGLPTDQMSTENAIIFEYTDRWPLLVDPQLQGLKWIKHRYGDALLVTNPTKRNYLDMIEGAVKLGQTVLLENIGESVDSVLDNLLSRTFIKKGRVIQIGDKDVEFHADFKLVLQTKLANPHYKPELQAQTTLINFAVTKDGLEDQLLGEVVKAERPDLETAKSELTEMQNLFKIRLQRLEFDLLEQLSTSGDDVLANPSLVINLEETKKIAKDVEAQACQSRISSTHLDEAREQYRTVAKRASILYFVLNDLFKINRMYQFSLKSFVVIFKRAIAHMKPLPSQEEADDLKLRVHSLTESITYAIFLTTCRGLFERDKLVFIMQMVLQIFGDSISAAEKYFFFKFPTLMNNIVSPVDYLPDRVWGAVQQLALIKGYVGIDQSILKLLSRWRSFIEANTPELEKMPGEWHKKSAFQRLVILRTLRPDRVIYAAWNFIEDTMGTRYMGRRMVSLAETFDETSASIPIFFILSAGVDPLVDVEKLGQQLGFCIENSNFHNVSLGQGQEMVAETTMREAKINGDWVVLQNIHLVANWLPVLNAIIEDSEDSTSHPDYRLFISAEPAPCPEDHSIPQGILESSLKVTNEPPTGMRANIHKALDTFSQDTLEMCTKETEFKSILFALCFFHSIMLERRRFGAQGWNKDYPFSIGDLTISVYVLYNYLEANRIVPWEDLRYLVGEIMYGGHITDDFDRRLCQTYLNEYLQSDLIDGVLTLCHGFEAPSNNDFKGYHKYIRDNLPTESPTIYGMHTNSEIDFLTNRTNVLLDTIFELQRCGSAFVVQDGRPTKEEMLKLMIEEYQDKLPDDFVISELADHQDYPSPYSVVVVQETQRMNVLFSEIRRSLRELWLGLRGELNMTSGMEHLEERLLYHKVPDSWMALAYPSNMELNAWFNDLLMRHRELLAWNQNMQMPFCVWLGGLFNPQSFLTAIMQSTARKNKWPLDRMCLNVDVTSKYRHDFSSPPKDGALVFGLFMEGARWDVLSNSIDTSKSKELYAEMPVVFIKATTQDKQDVRNIYECPIYRTKWRGSTYIWTFNLKTRVNPSKWILGGVAILLQT